MLTISPFQASCVVARAQMHFGVSAIWQWRGAIQNVCAFGASLTIAEGTSRLSRQKKGGN